MSYFYPSARRRVQIAFYAQLLQAAAIVLGGGWALWSYGRQLEAPYDEKQLNLYLEAAKVVADLAKLPPGQDKVEAEQRFWELYWGELSFVESRAEDAGSKSIETRMVRFCSAYFGKEKCKPDSLSECAIYLSHKASDEIQAHWKPWRRWVNWLWKKSDDKEPCPQSPDPATSSPAAQPQ
jgi:hypothetical protein